MVYYAPQFFRLRISYNFEIWKKCMLTNFVIPFSLSKIFDKVFITLFLGTSCVLLL